ncbi:MAG: endonuclease [Bacteroidales bacterium]|nr:endonuclease/exonuclease/phosphatase family protein [Lentimicrobiaceae bacterium]MDD5694120.1 endonuclease [Bacteroidales bacterium]
MMRYTIFFIVCMILCSLIPFHAVPQQKGKFRKYSGGTEPLFEDFNDLARDSAGIRIVFYNLENLYDPFNDSLTNDDEFTPEGAKHWNYGRYITKIQYLAKNLLAIGGWEPPEIIGVCEAENRNVLNKLIFDTPLSAYHYRIIHHESPDPRGVDVALLYRPDKITVLSDTAIPVVIVPDTVARTRDILYARLLVMGKDTLHVFVNHWPSRFGGYMQTVEKRALTAAILRRFADSVQHCDSLANIVIMGDLNDDPQDESISRVLLAGDGKLEAGGGKQPVQGNPDNGGVTREPPESDLVNLMTGNTLRGYAGTLKHGETWHTFDQFIVSRALAMGAGNLEIPLTQMLIFRAPYLLVEDPNRFGSKLNRTYLGPRYLGGFSDHLPIFLDITIKH